jgi:leucyl-tRNA synthetase
MAYPFSSIEQKWQARWDADRTFRTPPLPAPGQRKFYVLDMFPYPSGRGLHVGHPEGYTATDILARYRRMKGDAVLHPMGWDSFGLPAEQYAIKTGEHPSLETRRNIDTFRRQLKMLGFSYDWDRELATTDEAYVRWTQWIFLQLFKRGLAYETEMPVNWAPEMCAVLANEEVEEWRAKGFTVVRRPMRQWVLRITAYAERLLEGLDKLDWPASVKEMQRNWIGKSTGAEVVFRATAGEEITVYTTRCDTLFGCTYMVLSPEHALVAKWLASGTVANAAAVKAYCEEAARKSDLERTDLAKEKTGVRLEGVAAVNPVNGKEVPIYVADYVLSGYGTGAIMAVPAHDGRDWDFAKAFGLPVVQVVSPDGSVPAGEMASCIEEVATGNMVNSGFLDGLSVADAQKKMIAWLEEKGLGKAKTQYKLRDWLFSRQRFWGEPFPLVHCEKCGVVPVPESELPVRLPTMKDYRPTADGAPPLARAEDWVRTTCPKCGGPAKRETNTMPQWAGSCWYYLRYIDPANDTAFVDPAKEKAWMPVDLYVGGAEHAVLHLLYARFWHKVLFDLGLVSTDEPFQKLVNQGMILGTSYKDEQGVLVANDCVEFRDGKPFRASDGAPLTEFPAKMSKSLKNVVNPDDVIRTYGADSMRLYEMFMGPLEAVKPWNTRNIEGVSRFLNRVWRLVVADDETGAVRELSDAAPDADQERALHAMLKAVTQSLEAMSYNTAISAMMIFLNAAAKWEKPPRAAVEPFVLALSPFAPHLAEELWEKLGHGKTLAYEPWPEYDESKLAEDTVELPVQVNGKLRGKVVVAKDATAEQVFEAVFASEALAGHFAGKTAKKRIYVPGRLVNIVV